MEADATEEQQLNLEAIAEADAIREQQLKCTQLGSGGESSSHSAQRVTSAGLHT